MVLETVKAEGLAHLSYVIGDERAGECAVIDPRRDVGIYLEIARHRGMRITHVLETHIHADFVSGSAELAAHTGAPICVGAAEGYGFAHVPLRDGDIIVLGELSLRVLPTPGHTPEHVSFLASGGEGASAPWAVFTGDTLFAGEVGRPDLLGDGSEECRARQLFHSLRERLLTLGDDVEVYPAHGRGSPCGGSIGDRDTTTVGYERRHNPKLQIADEDAFVRAVLADLPPAPAYYGRVKRINAVGPPLLGFVPVLMPVSPERFREEMERPDTLVVDTREIEAFGGAHIGGAINIPLREEEFAIWAGWMLRPRQRLLLVLASEDDTDDVSCHLMRVGIDDVVGYLGEGMPAWFEAGLPFDCIAQMSVYELHARLGGGDDALQVVDARRDDEWAQGRIPTAQHLFAPDLPDLWYSLDKAKPVAVYCGTGYRAGIAASLLQRLGFADVYNVPGGISAWNAAGYPLEPASAKP